MTEENKNKDAIMEFTIQDAIKRGVKVGKDCKFATGIHWGSEPYLISIGNHVAISDNVDFITHDGGTWVFRHLEKYKGVMKIGRIKIHDNCMIGARTIILPCVEIGSNCVVGAGSVVTKSLKPNGVYAGNPAKFICSTKEYVHKCIKNHMKYNKNYVRSENRKERIESLLEGYKVRKTAI